MGKELNIIKTEMFIKDNEKKINDAGKENVYMIKKFILESGKTI